MTLEEDQLNETKKTDHPEGGERFQVLSRIINSIKEDKPVTLTPCGLKLVRCTQGGIEEIKGFEDLGFRDRLYVMKVLLEIHQDIFSKRREIDAAEIQEKAQKDADQARGMSKIIQATGG